MPCVELVVHKGCTLMARLHIVDTLCLVHEAHCMSVVWHDTIHDVILLAAPTDKPYKHAPRPTLKSEPTRKDWSRSAACSELLP